LPIQTASSSKPSNYISVKDKVGISVGVFVFVGAAVLRLWLIRRKFRERRIKEAAADTPPTRLEWRSELDTPEPINEMSASNGAVEMEGDRPPKSK
jgi:hypothetical protein